MSKDAASVAHSQAYDSYFSTHFAKYQSLDPAPSMAFYKRLLGDQLPASKDARILELGTGLGKFAYFLKQRGYTKITCVDISAELAKLAKEHSGVDVQVVPEPLDFLRGLPAGSFDAVVMLDVIEHVRKESVVEYLTLVRRALTPKGRFYVTTENVASPVGGRIQHHLDFTHEYNFTEISLDQALRVAGFQTVYIRGHEDGITGLRSAFFWTLRRLLFALYHLAYWIERPGMVRPRIFAKELVAVASPERD